MQWPQITMIVLFAMSIGVSMATHGQTKVTSLWSTLLAAAIELWILYEGGFFPH